MRPKKLTKRQRSQEGGRAVREAFLCVLAALVLGTWLAGCGPTPPTSDPQSFRIVAENEVQSLQAAGLFEAFTAESGIDVSLTYRGPVDIKAAINALGANNPGTVDAYWPGSSLWLPGSTPVEPHSVMKTYVVLAVDRAAAGQLGWDPRAGITAVDLVDAIRAGQINLAMPSASQSNAGTIFYLAMYTALASGQVLTSADLDDPAAVEGIQALLRGIDRSAESVEHLMQVVFDDQVTGVRRYNAAVLYESLAIELNQKLATQGQPPFTVFYVQGATAIADVPIRYVDNGNGAKAAQYRQLVDFLSRPDVQQKILARGWRTNPIGMAQPNADPAVFNPAWGINTTTEFPELRLPKAPVVTAALSQYQRAFRKPSFTAYCLDYSGSMRSNGGREQMTDAMDLLLDQERASEVLLDATPQDVTVVFGFASGVAPIGTLVTGNDPQRLKELSRQINGSPLSGSTALFSCLQYALTYLNDQYDPDRYQYAVIAMTDGASNAGLKASEFADFYTREGLAIPVYGIAFGDADYRQLSGLTETGGVVYDGRADIATAFRQARGNN